MQSTRLTASSTIFFLAFLAQVVDNNEDGSYKCMLKRSQETSSKCSYFYLTSLRLMIQMSNIASTQGSNSSTQVKNSQTLHMYV
ncbi:hypothetical protein Hanom_Chr12g01083401 [Helianthus anomalus]